jgi:hypothetical protein
MRASDRGYHREAIAGVRHVQIVVRTSNSSVTICRRASVTLTAETTSKPHRSRPRVIMSSISLSSSTNSTLCTVYSLISAMQHLASMTYLTLSHFLSSPLFNYEQCACLLIMDTQPSLRPRSHGALTWCSQNDAPVIRGRSEGRVGINVSVVLEILSAL